MKAAQRQLRIKTVPDANRATGMIMILRKKNQVPAQPTEGSYWWKVIMEQSCPADRELVKFLKKARSGIGPQIESTL